MGETRETRSKEFYAHPSNDISVLGIREGSWVLVYSDQIKKLLSLRLVVI